MRALILAALIALPIAASAQQPAPQQPTPAQQQQAMASALMDMMQQNIRNFIDTITNNLKSLQTKVSSNTKKASLGGTEGAAK